MTKPIFHNACIRCLAIAVVAALVTGCSALSRLSQVGETPTLTKIQNPAKSPGYQPVSLPMPAVQKFDREPNSLWRPGSRAFFRDQRANQVGDILTVIIDIDDSAEINNTSERSRVSKEDASLGALLGYEASLNKILPEAVVNTDLVDIDGSNSNKGTGKIDREEDIELKVAVIVTQILPNGNLVIQGHQEVRVNYEVRELQVHGVIRREDITSSNTISYDQIAEARIAYGGRGHISEVQQPRYGYQVMDILFPF